VPSGSLGTPALGPIRTGIFSVTRITVAVLLLSLGGCLQVGPSTIVHDRFKYNQAIRDSWEEQMLTNMVAIRYGESPVFLNVNSVIAQYGLETSARVVGGINTGLSGDDTLQGNASAVWSERPTITYAPVEGKEFAENLLTPISPTEIFALIEAGWNARRSLRLLLKSINGVKAYDPVTQQQNPRFFRILDAFRTLQEEEILGVRREASGEEIRTFLYLRNTESNPDLEDAYRVLDDDLKLSQTAQSVEVVFGPFYTDAETIAIQTNSVMDILNEIAAYITVPDVHAEEGRTYGNRRFDISVPDRRPPLRVLSSETKPQDVLVAVQNRGYWFYIDDKDIASKEAFSFLMILMQLTAAQQESREPVVTIGSGR